MTSLAPNTYSPLDAGMSRRAPDYEMDRVIHSTWHVLEQTPPPTLREVLGAYNSRGDGDRDMLIAMLNAKSAEDQRIASVAALHKTLLERQHTPSTSAPPSLPQLHGNHYYPPTASSSRPKESRHERRASDMSSGRSRSPAIARHASPSSHSSRKRRRTSRDFSPPHHTSDESYSSTLHDPSPSPYSSSRSDSANSSPRSRASMAIGSLLGPSSKDAPRTYMSDIRATPFIPGPTSLPAVSV